MWYFCCNMFWAGVESKTLSRHVVHLWTRLGTARNVCVQNALLRSGSHVFRWNTRSWLAGSEFSPNPQNDPTRLTSSLSIFIMNHHESIQFFQYGYGSIPIFIPFLVGWISIYQLWLGVHIRYQGFEPSPYFSLFQAKKSPFFVIFCWVVALVPRRPEKSCRVTCEWPLVPFWVGQYDLYILR